MIDSPEELRRLPVEALRGVADELRGYIIETLSTHPGHLASSLGTVELTVALHYVFNTPDDKLVWDVGHQAYGHKILTGRREAFAGIRTMGGISGFPRREESEYDAFGTGHSSTSISAALGMATASRLAGNVGRKHIAVIGDGALTGGEAFEALNNAGTSKANLLVVLNDNGISIDKAVGGLNGYLLKVTSSRRYNELKRQVWQHTEGREWWRRWLSRLTQTAKALALGRTNLFEALGIRYFGPIDGHDLPHLVATLQRLKGIEGPVLLHVVTRKGRGLRRAEENPVTYHSPGRYNAATGERIAQRSEGKGPKYQDVFGATLVELAERFATVVGITPAMATGCGMTGMMERFPERTFDVGIAEQHAVTFAAGLAAGGMTPFCNIYSSFAQRAYDQIVHDVALQKLHVVLCLDRAGLVGEDGATHHGAFDLAMLRPIPNLTIAAPSDEHELRRMMYTACVSGDGAFVIRYPRGAGVLADWRCELEALEVGKGRKIFMSANGKGSANVGGMEARRSVALVCIGAVLHDALQAAERLRGEGWSTDVYDIRFLKPLDEDLLDEVAQGAYEKVVTVEDGVKKGGFGEAVMCYFADKHPEMTGKTTVLGIDDTFVMHGSVGELKHLCGIDAEGIYGRVMGVEI